MARTAVRTGKRPAGPLELELEREAGSSLVGKTSTVNEGGDEHGVEVSDRMAG